MTIRERADRWWHGIVAPGWVRPRPTRHQRQIDVTLVVSFLVVAAGSSVLVTSMAGMMGALPMSWPLQLIWILILGMPLIWRRRFPIVVSVVVSAAFIASQQLGFLDNLMASVSLFWALYSVGAWAQNRLVAFWVRCAIVAAMFASIVLNIARYRDEIFSADPTVVATGLLDPFVANVLYNLLLNVFYFAASTYLGTVAWTSARREHQLAHQAEALADQAAALATAQQENALRAVMRERVRIARELHDVVAHHVSVMGVQASAARRVLGKSPELASDALSAVENTARVAITELRGLLGVLRDVSSSDPEPRTPQPIDPVKTFHAAPDVEQIPELIASCERAGVRVVYGIYGTRRPIPGGVSLSIFRIVQEALTNVVKHAAASHVDVRLRFLESSIEVEVADDGVASDGVASDATPGVGGFGLVGMRERVAVHHGELVLGARPGGGYRVRATLPLQPAVAGISSTPVEVMSEVGVHDG